MGTNPRDNRRRKKRRRIGIQRWRAKLLRRALDDLGPAQNVIVHIDIETLSADYAQLRVWYDKLKELHIKHTNKNINLYSTIARQQGTTRQQVKLAMFGMNIGVSTVPIRSKIPE